MVDVYMDSVIYAIVVVIVTISIIISSIAIVIGVKFQKLKRNKYKELERIIKEKEGIKFEVKDSLTEDEIKRIDPEVNVSELMKNLYDTFLLFQEKAKKLENNFDDVLYGELKEFYINKIDSFSQNGYLDITDKIELNGYDIIEFTKKELKFRLNINCIDYKKIADKIVSGSNNNKVHQVLLITYRKVNDKWLITAYEKLIQKNLSV